MSEDYELFYDYLQASKQRDREKLTGEEEEEEKYETLDDVAPRLNEYETPKNTMEKLRVDQKHKTAHLHWRVIVLLFVLLAVLIVIFIVVFISVITSMNNQLAATRRELESIKASSKSTRLEFSSNSTLMKTQFETRIDSLLSRINTPMNLSMYEHCQEETSSASCSSTHHITKDQQTLKLIMSECYSKEIPIKKKVSVGGGGWVRGILIPF